MPDIAIRAESPTLPGIRARINTYEIVPFRLEVPLSVPQWKSTPPGAVPGGENLGFNHSSDHFRTSFCDRTLKLAPSIVSHCTLRWKLNCA